jgi:hypothetical protein
VELTYACNLACVLPFFAGRATPRADDPPVRSHRRSLESGRCFTSTSAAANPPAGGLRELVDYVTAHHVGASVLQQWRAHQA